MKNRLIGYTDIETLYQEHLRQEAKVWDNLTEHFYQVYLSEGYLAPWAKVKATQQMYKLRSLGRKSHQMTIPPEQTKQGDLD